MRASLALTFIYSELRKNDPFLVFHFVASVPLKIQIVSSPEWVHIRTMHVMFYA